MNDSTIKITGKRKIPKYFELTERKMILGKYWSSAPSSPSFKHKISFQKSSEIISLKSDYSNSSNVNEESKSSQKQKTQGEMKKNISKAIMNKIKLTNFHQYYMQALILQPFKLTLKESDYWEKEFERIKKLPSSKTGLKNLQKKVMSLDEIGNLKFPFLYYLSYRPIYHQVLLFKHGKNKKSMKDKELYSQEYISHLSILKESAQELASKIEEKEKSSFFKQSK